MKLPHLTEQDIRHALVGAALIGFVALNAVTEGANAGVQSRAGPEARGVYRTTAYCLRGITASGTQPRAGVVATSAGEFAFRTVLLIEGYGNAVVEDRGGAITRGRLDVWFASCRDAINWGVRYVKVWVLP